MGISNLSDRALEKAFSVLKRLKEQGIAEPIIAKRMGVTLKELDELKMQLIDSEAKKLHETAPENTYLEYVFSQKKNINDLTTIIDRHMTSTLPPNTAIVTAIKTRSDILSRIIEKGQEFGFIEKKPERREIIAGITVTHMSDEELRSAVLDKLTSMGNMLSKYGPGAIEDVIDVDPGPVYKAIPREIEDESPLETPAETTSG